MTLLRVEPMPAPADPVLLAALVQVETATIGHMRHTGFVHRSIAALRPGQHARAGVAVTLALPAMCSTLMHHAVSQLRPGDMLVVDRLGDDRHACLGGAVARAVRMSGAAGVILDGPCTDAEEILAEGLALWCRGVSQVTTRRLGLGGAFNRPVACGNVPVLPGDLVLADASGVVILPPDEAAATAADAIARQGRGARTMQRLATGEKLGDITGASQAIADHIRSRTT